LVGVAVVRVVGVAVAVAVGVDVAVAVAVGVALPPTVAVGVDVAVAVAVARAVVDVAVDVAVGRTVVAVAVGVAPPPQAVPGNHSSPVPVGPLFVHGSFPCVQNCAVKFLVPPQSRLTTLPPRYAVLAFQAAAHACADASAGISKARALRNSGIATSCERRPFMIISPPRKSPLR
jgi:hypothetical protein